MREPRAGELVQPLWRSPRHIPAVHRVVYETQEPGMGHCVLETGRDRSGGTTVKTQGFGELVSTFSHH